MYGCILPLVFGVSVSLACEAGDGCVRSSSLLQQKAFHMELQLRPGNRTSIQTFGDIFGLPNQGIGPVHHWPTQRRLSHFQMGVLLSALTLSVVLSHFSAAEVTSSISSWISASVCTNLLNKEAASSFQATCLLVILQMFIANVVVIVARFRDLQCPSLWDFLRWLPVSFLISGMLGTSIFALEGTTVSTVNIIRNVLPIITFALEKLLFNSPRTIRPGHILSMFLTLFGTTLYGFYNFSVTRYCLMMILLGCVLTVVDKLLQRHLLMSPDFQQPLAVCMVMNNTFGMLPLLLVAILTGEAPTWSRVVAEMPGDGWLIVISSGLSGCCLGFYGLAVSKLVSAASVLMLQNTSKVMVILLSVILLGDDISGLSALGCFLSVLGSAWYGYVALSCQTAADSKASAPRSVSKKEAS
mmetsp:Transcript_60788/g.113664  ORF Transcript_60788/g.113664 Transcript_60788/m.113664 type:complete len:413 (-) Transcript_60788:9-1247(-)